MLVFLRKEQIDMSKSKRLSILTDGLVLFLTTNSMTTSVLADTNTVESPSIQTNIQATEGFVDHIWYQTTFFHESRPYVFVTVTRENQAFRGYIQRRYTQPTGHGPTGVLYGGYLFNTKLKSYPIPTLNKKLPKLEIENIPNSTDLK